MTGCVSKPQDRSALDIELGRTIVDEMFGGGGGGWQRERKLYFVMGRGS